MVNKNGSGIKASDAKNLKVSVYSDIYNKNGSTATIKEVLDTIKESRGIKHQIVLIRNTKEKEKRNSLKRDLPIFTPSGLFNGARKEENLGEYSGLICFDFDSLEEPDEVKQELNNDVHVLACFLSPSGRGLKLLVQIDGSKHKEYWYQLEHYFKNGYNLVVDPNPKSVTASCYYSYDPDIYINWEAKKFELEEDFKYPQAKSNHYVEPDEKLFAKVEDCISQLEEKGIDITSTRKDWLDVGFALTHAFGEEGREFFQRICAFYPKYKKDECD